MTVLRGSRSPLIIFDGQSLNDNPYASGTGYAFRLCQNLKIPGNNTVSPLQAWIGGIAWLQLDDSFGTRVAPYLKAAPVVMYHMMGGTTDLALTASGLTVYQRMRDQAITARAAGATYVSAATISTWENITVLAEAARVDANSRIMADADGAFDDSINLTPTPGAGFNDAASGYFSLIEAPNRTHWNNTGRNAAVAIAEPIIRARLGL